jgi:hypothetical protein
MPITYTIDSGKRRVLAVITGTLTEDELFAYQTEVWSRAEVAGYDQIVDTTGVQHIAAPEPSGDSMRRLAALAAGMDDRDRRSRFAIVAPGDLAFGMGRMYSTYREMEPRSTKRVSVFRTMGEALAWLDAPEGGNGS